MPAVLMRFGPRMAALLVAALAVAGSRHMPLAHAPHSDVSATLEKSEIARVRAHLARVETELRSADVSRLSPAQRASRSHHIEVLHDYREAGAFPHNHTSSRDYTPVFVDEHGTHCAMAFLLAESGRDDIVNRVAARRNYAHVPELANDPDLVAWLDVAGLTLDEAARIQPSYNGPSRSRERIAYSTSSIIASGVGGGMIAWNLLADRSDTGRTLPGAFGIGVGLADIVLGGVGVVQSGHGGSDIESSHIALNLVVGLASTALGVRTLLSDPPPPSTSVARSAKPEDVAWSVSPWHSTETGGAGLLVSLRF